MTSTWPVAPRGTAWADVDRLVGVVQPVVEAECRPGGVHQVRWDPEKRTTVAYDDVRGDVVALEATPGSLRRTSLLDDTALTGLADLLDPVALGGRLEQLLGEPLRVRTTTPVSYRPGSRCVLRCEITAASGERTVFVKVLAGGWEDYLESHDVLAGRRKHPIVPPLVGSWPDLAAVVTEAVPGPSASAVLADGSSPPEDRLRLAAGVGALLARAHRATPGPRAAARGHSVTDELAELPTYLPAAWHADPAAALSLGWALDRLAAAAPQGGAQTFSHGSFRAGQVVVDGDRLAVLDLDSAGLADPARDLGNTMAYLDWQDIRGGVSIDTDTDLAGAVRRGYLYTGGEFDPDALDWWHAAALLKIAGRRYRSLDASHWGAVPSLVATASDLLERRRPRPSHRVVHVRTRRLPDIADPVPMTALLRDQLRGQLGGEGCGTLRIVAAQTLRVAPGRRVVVRYRVAGGAEGPVEIIAKAYAERGRAVLAHENLVLFDGLRDPAVRCGTQEPVGVRRDLGIVLCRSAQGHPVAPLPTAAGHPTAGDRADPSEASGDEVAVEAAGHLGSWLRRVHSTRAGASRSLDVSHEAANARVWAERIGRSDPRLLAPARELADVLASTASTLPVVVDSLIHKDLHLAHVLVDDEGDATVIDLDEARMGDPAFDVAHLCAYAQEYPPRSAERATSAFLCAYGPVPGPDAGRRLAFFRAYSLLKITRQATGGRVTDDVVAASLRRLNEGATWLAG